MAGLSNFLRNKIVDWLHRGQPYTPPAVLYFELCSTQPIAGTPGTPLAGTGYARLAVDATLLNWSGTQAPGSTAASSGTSGQTSNNVAMDYGIAAAAWGTASHWEAYDAASSGNRIFFGEIVDGVGTPTPRVISIGDPVLFPIGSFRLGWG